MGYVRILGRKDWKVININGTVPCSYTKLTFEAILQLCHVNYLIWFYGKLRGQLSMPWFLSYFINVCVLLYQFILVY